MPGVDTREDEPGSDWLAVRTVAEGESAYISGAKTGSYNQESGTVTQQGVARGVATLSAGKVTVTCVMAGTSSQIHLNTLSGAPVAVGVKERKAGSFVIESSASSSDQVAWAVYPM